MGTIQFPSEGVLQPYGTTQYQQVQLVSIIPEQIVGLVQCRPETDDCRGEPCQEIKVLDGDKNSFLFMFASDENVSGLVDDYRLEVWINDTWQEVITGNTNNTLDSESGTKFTFGSFPDYPFYSGYQVDWNKIFEAGFGGGGTYRFKVQNIFDVDTPLYSPPFVLMENTCENANSTFYLETTSTGKVRNWRFTNENDIREFLLINTLWDDSCRYFGRFDPTDKEVEDDFVLFNTAQNKLHKAEQEQNYNLRLFKTTYEYFSRLFEYGLVGNNINITDSNHDAIYNLTNIKVVRESSNEFTQYVNNRSIFEVNIGLRGEFNQGFNQC